MINLEKDIINKEIVIHLQGDKIVEHVESCIKKETGVDVKVSLDYGDPEDNGLYYFMIDSEELSEDDIKTLESYGYDVYSTSEFTNAVFNSCLNTNSTQTINEYHTLNYIDTIFPIRYEEDNYNEFVKSLEG